MTEHPTPRALETPLAVVKAACIARHDIEAAWLEGSVARGEADEWSDLDLHLVVADDGFDVHAWVAGMFDVVLADAIPGTRRGHIFLTSEWVHLDVVLHSPRETVEEDTDRRFLLDRRMPSSVDDGAAVSVGEEPGPASDPFTAPYFPDQECRVVLYLLGNAVGLAARNDLHALSTTVSGLRDGYLVRLMLAERGLSQGPGAKRVLDRLSRDQRAALIGLPPSSLDRESLLNVLVSVAADYLPRARALARATGAGWPQPLEEALRSLWSREMGRDLP